MNRFFHLQPTPSLARAALALLLGPLAATGCEEPPARQDGGSGLALRSSEVAIRVEVPAGARPSVSLLSFRASGTSLGAEDVLPSVDPLVAAGPQVRSGCELRHVDEQAQGRRPQREPVELADLSDVTLTLGDGERLRPSPRVFPGVAPHVSGVIAEAGPIDLEPLSPDATSPLGFGIELSNVAPLRIELPPVPRLFGERGEPIHGLELRAGQSFTFGVAGGSSTFVELRPFGAPVWASCAVGPEGRVLVDGDITARLLGGAERAPVSIEAVARGSRREPQETGSLGLRVTTEVRSSALVELVP